jgi:tetratricopeptide (TPR) repeat protein
MKKNRVVILCVLIGVMIGGCAGIKGIKEKFLGPNKKELVQTYMRSGQEYENKGDLVQALKQYKLALTVDPKNQEAIEKIGVLEKNMRILAQEHYRNGIKLRKKGKYHLARKEFLTALELQPDHLEALRALKPKKEIHAKKYIIHTIKPGESLSMVAKTYYGDYEKFPIIAEFNNMSDATQITVGQKIKVPEIEGMRFLASKREIKTEDVKAPDSVPLDQETITDENHADQEPIDEAINYLDLGIEHFDNKEYQAAIVEFNKVLNASPDDKSAREYLYKAHFQHGVALFEKEDYPAAKKNFETSLSYNKDCQKCRDYINKSDEIYMETHYNRGLSYYGNQQLAEAIREWELVHAVDPNYREVEKDIKKAKTLLERLESIKKGMQ